MSTSEETPGVLLTSSGLDQGLPPSLEREKKTSGLFSPEVVSLQATARSCDLPAAIAGCDEIPGVFERSAARDQVLPPSADEVWKMSGFLLPLSQPSNATCSVPPSA